MNKEIDFETYLIISYGKFEIILLDIKNHKNIYQEEFKFRDVSEKLDFNLLNDFLENNIFKIEKLSRNFVNNINIVIENKSILTSNIGIKKKNYTGEITDIILENMLTDVKDLFKENYNQYKLIHMIIDKYIIDGVSYSSLQDQISNDEICLEIKLISIPNLLILEIENILKKYQIQVNNFLEKAYVKDFFLDKQLDISQMAHNLKNGKNKNEIQITSKSSKKIGFFEKFFQLFS
ncbi:hypothetical protein [Candidatus Pelagibacter sp. HIMB1593]|uniref:hypothetical protein n=1 Tax=Candidatus Pelagibacter sp. HIMB1593 TaxID=3413355 RepID=UPI003F8262DD